MPLTLCDFPIGISLPPIPLPIPITPVDFIADLLAIIAMLAALVPHLPPCLLDEF